MEFLFFFPVEINICETDIHTKYKTVFLPSYSGEILKREF